MQEFGRPVARGGISSATLNFLKLCSIMEPMQELFSFHKVIFLYILALYRPLLTFDCHNWYSDVPDGAARMPQKLSFSKMVENYATNRTTTRGSETTRKEKIPESWRKQSEKTNKSCKVRIWTENRKLEFSVFLVRFLSLENRRSWAAKRKKMRGRSWG